METMLLLLGIWKCFQEDMGYSFFLFLLIFFFFQVGSFVPLILLRTLVHFFSYALSFCSFFIFFFLYLFLQPILPFCKNIYARETLEILSIYLIKPIKHLFSIYSQCRSRTFCMDQKGMFLRLLPV